MKPKSSWNDLIPFNHASLKPLRLPKGFPPSEAAEQYERRSIVAMENDEWHKSEVYAEWARLERVRQH